MTQIKITFFGASVTAQKTGFAVCYKKYNPNADIKIFGYGSTQLVNAGVCYIDTALESNPDILIVDFVGSKCFPLTRRDVRDSLETIIQKCFLKQCKLMFIILIDTNTNCAEKSEKCIKLFDSYGLNYFDIYGFLQMEKYNNIDMSKMFRDSTHTTDYGSDIYAKLLHENCNFDMLTIPPNIPNKNKLFFIEKISAFITATKNVVFDGNCEIIGIDQFIGPYSGIVLIENNKETKKYNLWDQWCDYERSNIKFNCNVIGITKITILADDFDRSKCKNDINWNTFEKKIKFNTIFYIGESLNIVSFE